MFNSDVFTHFYITSFSSRNPLKGFVYLAPGKLTRFLSTGLHVLSQLLSPIIPFIYKLQAKHYEILISQLKIQV